MDFLSQQGGLARAVLRPAADYSAFSSSLTRSRMLPRFCASVLAGLVLGAPVAAQAARLSLSSSSEGVLAEGDGPSTLNVILDEGGDFPLAEGMPCEVRGTLTLRPESATPGEDFVLSSQSFTVVVSHPMAAMAAMAAPRTAAPVGIQLSVADDALVEDDESFAVEITDVQDDCLFPGGIDNSSSGEGATRFTIADNDEEEVPPEQPRSLSDTLGLTPRQREVALALDTACQAIEAVPAEQRSAREAELLAACQRLDGSATLGADLDALAFRSVTSLGLLTRQSALLRAQNLSRLIDRRRQGRRGLDLADLRLHQDGQVVSGDLLTRGAGAGDPQDFGRWGAFLGGSLEVGEYEPNPATAGYDFDVRVFLAGVDYRLSPNWVLGGAVGYTDADSELDAGRGESEMQGGSLALFASYYRGDTLYLDAILSAGRSDYSTRRSFTAAGVGQSASGESDGNEYTATLNAGYFFRWPSSYLRVFGTVNYVNADIDGFAERPGDGGASGSLLQVGGQSLESTTVGLGGELGWTYNTAYAVLSPQLTLECEHRFGDDIRTGGGRFLGDPTATTFSIDTAAPDRNYCHGAAGLSSILPGGLSAYTLYRHSLLRDDLDSGELSLGVRGEF